eukprot:scaffold245559_cov18-Prasinocladus_malaysianus.AAC.1
MHASPIPGNYNGPACGSVSQQTTHMGDRAPYIQDSIYRTPIGDHARSGRELLCNFDKRATLKHDKKLAKALLKDLTSLLPSDGVTRTLLQQDSRRCIKCQRERLYCSSCDARPGLPRRYMKSS